MCCANPMVTSKQKPIVDSKKDEGNQSTSLQGVIGSRGRAAREEEKKKRNMKQPESKIVLVSKPLPIY